MGARPGTSDFSLFGQLTQLALFDPTPMALALAIAPSVTAYTDLVDDLSGLESSEDHWFSREELPRTFHDLLSEVGRVHAPFLLGNHAALENRFDRVECEIDGLAWTQKPFPYQGKCLKWLRHDYQALTPGDRAFVDQALAGTGVQTLFD